MQLLPIVTAAILERADICSSQLIRHACDATLALYPASGPVEPWLGYLAVVNNRIIGTCVFKSLPLHRSVEIGYFTFPDYEGRGYATTMAARLIAIARQHALTTVTAHTLPYANASARIVEKLGFIHSGCVMHPRDGEMWLWKRYLSE